MWPDCGSCEGLKLFLLFSPNLTHSAGCSSCSFQGDGAAQRCRRGDREPQPSGQRQPRRERGERGQPGLQWPPAVQGGPSGGQRQPGSSAKQTERHTTEATWRWGVSTQTHAAWIQSLNIRVTFNYRWTEAADSDGKLCNSCTHYSNEVDAQRGGSSYDYVGLFCTHDTCCIGSILCCSIMFFPVKWLGEFFLMWTECIRTEGVICCADCKAPSGKLVLFDYIDKIELTMQRLPKTIHGICHIWLLV